MNMNLSVRKNGLKLIIFEDCVEDPREYNKDTNIGTMVCFHHRLELGDENNFKDIKEFEEWYEQHKEEMRFRLPIYLIDNDTCNGCVSVTTDEDDYRETCGLLGYIYCTKERLKEFGNLYEGDDVLTLKSILEDEVDDYDNWLQNIPPYYSFEILDKDKNQVESMGVFEYYSIEQMLDEMKERSEHKYDFLFDAALKKYDENYM